MAIKYKLKMGIPSIYSKFSIDLEVRIKALKEVFNGADKINAITSAYNSLGKNIPVNPAGKWNEWYKKTNRELECKRIDTINMCRKYGILEEYEE